MGRPRQFDSPEKMQVAIDDYFEKAEIPTITGLTLHLGFINRKALLNYEGYSEEYYATIKRAKSRCAEYVEKLLLGKGVNKAGPIFWLKNHGWSDVQTQIHGVTDDLGVLLGRISGKDDLRPGSDK